MSPWILRAGMTGAFFANGLSYGSWIGSLPRLRESAGLTDARLGLVLLAMAVGATCAMPLAGAMAARIGSGRVTLLTGIGLAGALALPSLMNNWPLLLGAAALVGMLMGSMDVAMNARGGEIETARGRPIMSSLHAGWSLGSFSGAALAATLASAGVALPTAMAVAALSAATLMVIGSVVRERGTVLQGSLQGLRLPNRALAVLSVLTLLAFVSEGSVADWNGVYLRTVVGVSAARAATGFAIFSAAMVLARLVGDALVRAVGPAHVVRYGSGLAILGLALALSAQDATVAMAGFALVGLGLSNVAPVLFGAAGRRAGAPGVAVAATVGYGGQLAAPPLIGFLADAIGLRLALCLLLLSLAGSVILARALPSRVVRPAREAAPT